MSKLKIKAIPFIAAAALITVGCASQAGYDKTVPTELAINSNNGAKILTNSSGFTVYTFDKDQKNASNCYGPCATKWPPVFTNSAISDGKFTTTKRKDGSLQLQYNQQPLYLWVGDKAPGQTSGDGVKNVWHIVSM
jgi:predicted lipoprotein with Yx(FWY)xxD motif